jgi:hypothetical protein
VHQEGQAKVSVTEWVGVSPSKAGAMELSRVAQAAPGWHAHASPNLSRTDSPRASREAVCTVRKETGQAQREENQVLFETEGQWCPGSWMAPLLCLHRVGRARFLSGTHS